MKHAFTDEDRAMSAVLRREATRARIKAERALLNRLLAEAAMPEWYPER